MPNDSIVDGGSVGTAYGYEALTVTKIKDLQRVMNDLVRIAKSEESGIGAIESVSQGWKGAGETVATANAAFVQANAPLMASWHSKADSTIYKDATVASSQSLAVAAAAISGTNAGGPSNAGPSLPDALTNLTEVIRQVSAAVGTARDTLEAAVSAYRTSFQTGARSKGTGVPTEEQELAFVEEWRGHVLAAGAQLTMLGTHYTATGAQATAAAAELQWRGPGSGNGISPGSPGAPSIAPGGPSGAPTDAAPGGEQPGGEQPGGEQAGGEQPGGEQAGGEQPGGEQPSGEGGTPEIPAAPPTGPGLAGMPTPTIPKAPAMPPITLPDLPGANTPPVPVGGLPIGAVPGRGGTGGPRIPSAPGAPGGLGGPGGPKIPQAPGGVGVDKQIPRAAQAVTAPQALSGGQRPGATGSPFAAGGTGTSAPAGGGGMPPMMPPGGVGAGGKSGKSGGGPIRPVGRKRDRRKEETPGVPVGLRGKAGRDLPGAFPTAPASTRRRQQEAPPSQTLQLLDEDLWTVEEAKTATLPAHRRPAN